MPTQSEQTLENNLNSFLITGILKYYVYKRYISVMEGI